MTAIDSIVDRAGQSLGEGLPRVAAALLLLVVGLVVVRLLARLLARALRAAGADRLAERLGVHDALTQIGLERSFSRVLSAVVRLGLSVVVVLAALSLLGLQFLSDSLNAGILFLPRLLIALGLLLAGVVLGRLARERVDRLAYQMNLPGQLGRAAQIVVIAVLGLTALTQLGVSTEILIVLAGIVFAAAGLTMALSFGLGGRELARAMSAGRYVRGAFEVGQTITVEGIRGEIVRIDSAATVLRTTSGSTVRVPSHLLLERVVEVQGDPTEPGQPGE